MTNDRPHPASLALVCAMPMELTPLAKRLHLQKTTVRGVALRKGQLDGRPVVALATGMGTELATTSTERLLDAVDPIAHLVVFGITGAVDDEIEIGALVRPALVVNSETGSEHRPVPLGDEPMHGTMWTTNVMTPAAELSALVERGVVSLDMETAAIAECCERRGVPWSVVRSISDRATDDTIDDEVFHLAHQDGRPDPRAIARYASRHPLKMARLAWMGLGARKATIAAAEAAIAGARTLP